MEKPDNENIKRIVVDYIAGQTDKFFLNECELYLGVKCYKNITQILRL